MCIRDRVKAKDRKIEELNQKIAMDQLNSLFDSSTQIDGLQILSASFNGLTTQALRAMGDHVKEQDLSLIHIYRSNTKP